MHLNKHLLLMTSVAAIGITFPSLSLAASKPGEHLAEHQHLIIDFFSKLGLLFEVIAAIIIITSLIITLCRSIIVYRALGSNSAYEVARRTFAKGMLLCLELLIAADLLRTLAVDLTISSVAALGLLVIVRTILSWSIEIEMEGKLPWRMGNRKATKQ